MLPRVQRRPELKSNTVFLLRQLETQSEVSTVHNDQNVCTFTPLKEYTENRPTPLPFYLNHFRTIWDHRVAVLGPQEPRGLQNVQEGPGAPPDDSMLWLQMPWTLEESWRIMHCKFTDSSNGTSLQSKQNYKSSILSPLVTSSGMKGQ